MIFWQLFLTFLQIGAVSFGGGYGMISLIREQCLSHGWLTEEELMNFIAVSESTPGPLAVNMATFIGSSQGGLPGALCATLGVALPSFIIILVIAALIRNLLKYAGVQAALGGVRPVVVGLIVGTAITLLLSVVFSLKTVHGGTSFDWRALAIFGLVTLISFGFRRWRGKGISPILLILISAVLGIGFYGLI